MTYDRYHAVRVCREKCAEEGYYGQAFKDCVEECVKQMLTNEESSSS